MCNKNSNHSNFQVRERIPVRRKDGRGRRFLSEGLQVAEQNKGKWVVVFSEPDQPKASTAASVWTGNTRKTHGDRVQVEWFRERGKVKRAIRIPD